jgi:hypothetical protein
MITYVVLGLVGLAAVAITIAASRYWPGDKYLCDTCKYNDAEKCQKKERPHALICRAFNSGITN